MAPILKGRCLTLASLEMIRQRQHGRIKELWEGDVNTKYFRMKANAHRRKNLIPYLVHEGRRGTSQEENLDLLHLYFSDIMGSRHDRAHSIRLFNLDLRALEQPFSKEETGSTVMHLPSERVPGLDGFLGLFYKIYWDTTKEDMLKALHKLYAGNSQHLECLTQPSVPCSPKKNDP